MKNYRVDAYFDPHTPEVRARVKPWGARYQAWLTDPAEGRTAPIYLLEDTSPTRVNADQDPLPRVERSEVFNHIVIPQAEIQKWLESHGAVQQEYTTSTGVWMFKQALYEGRNDLQNLTIGIWGIDYEEHAEYLVQRPCMEFWIGFARALGVKVYVTPTSPLGRDEHVYGRDGDRPDLVHTHQPFRASKVLGKKAKVQPITVLQAMGVEPIHEIPEEIQKLIDEEKARGIDTHALWAAAAITR
jgi:hypothetical protein